MPFDKKQLTYIVLTFVLCYAIFSYWATGLDFLTTVYAASQPFIIGACLAYIVNIVMTVYEKMLGYVITKDQYKGIKRLLAMLMSYSTFVVAIIWIFSIVLPDLIASINSLLNIDTSVFREWFNTVNDNKYVARMIKYVGGESEIISTLTAYSQQILRQVLSVLTNLLTSVTSVASTLLNVFVSLIFSLYVLGSKEQLVRQAGLLIDTFLGKLAPKVHYVISILDARFRGFIISQTFEAMILGTLTAIGMTIFHFPYAATIGILVGFTAIIPVIGAYIGVSVGFILIATQSIHQALWFVVFMVILQQFEGNLIYPRVVGGSIGLPGMWVLVAITIGGALMGFGGMLIAVPVAASIYQIVKEYVTYKQGKQKNIT